MIIYADECKCMQLAAHAPVTPAKTEEHVLTMMRHTRAYAQMELLGPTVRTQVHYVNV